MLAILSLTFFVTSALARSAGPVRGWLAGPGFPARRGRRTYPGAGGDVDDDQLAPGRARPGPGARSCSPPGRGGPAPGARRRVTARRRVRPPPRRGRSPAGLGGDPPAGPGPPLGPRPAQLRLAKNARRSVATRSGWVVYAKCPPSANS